MDGKKYINTIVIGDIAVGTEVIEESIGSRWNSFVADGYIVEAPKKVVNVVGADCSELQEQVTKLQDELETAKQNVTVPGDFENLLADLSEAKTKADFEAVYAKYKVEE